MSVALRVHRPGLFTTVQDLGRFGYQHLGVPVSGALDSITLRVANALVNNAEGAAALEFCYAGPELEAVGGAVRVAVAGPVESRVDGPNARKLPPWQSALLQPGDILRVGSPKDRMCGYISVEGGIAVVPILGSRSTYVRASLGGFKGRALAAGDELPVGANARPREELCLAAPPPEPSGRIRVVLGPDHHHFHDEAISVLLSGGYRVGQEADRIGLRLDGPLLRHSGPFEIPSQGTANGTVQVPGTGKPIILLADRQTAGGYTKIATVISADLPRVGRLLPGALLRFEAVEPAAAIEIAREEARAFQALLRRMRRVEGSANIDAATLLGLNLVDGFVNALEAE
jgi:biotin-dependent carboxylase-like uncharacterized protein